MSKQITLNYLEQRKQELQEWMCNTKEDKEQTLQKYILICKMISMLKEEENS